MLLCAFLWSTAGVLFKYLPWRSLPIAGLRALIAGLTVASYVIITRRRICINRNTVLGGLAMAATCIQFVIANGLTTAANAIVLQFTAPIFLLILSALFFHTKFSRADLLAVAFTFVGIALFFFDQLDRGHILGNVIAIGAGFAMSLMYLFVNECTREERFTAILIAETIQFLVSVPQLISEPPVFNGITVPVILFLGIFQLGIPYILYAFAASACSPLVCSLLAAVEPLLNPVWVLLIFGEKPGLFALIGALIVIVTITAWCIVSARHAPAGEKS